MVEAFTYLNLVELFKTIGKKLAKKKSAEVPNIRISIDVFIVLKWTAVLGMWLAGFDHTLVTTAIAYLLIANIFTYFYYHVWHPPFNNDNENLRSRFVTMAIALCYNVVCFGYLYAIPFSSHFSASEEIGHSSGVLLFSIANSMLTDFPSVMIASDTGQVLVLLQKATTFIFVSMILTTSLPQFSKPRKS
jgi:hypothetical protein